MINVQNNRIQARELALMVIDDLIDRVIKRNVSQDEKNTVVSYTKSRIDACLKTFDQILNMQIVSKPLFYSEVEPKVSTKEKLSKFSLKFIDVTGLSEIHMAPVKTKPRVRIKTKSASRTDTNRSFKIHSGSKRHISQNQNRNFNAPADKNKMTQSKKINQLDFHRKAKAPRLYIPISTLGNKRRKTPEPAINVLDNEQRERMPQFNFFYNKKFPKPSFVDTPSRDILYKSPLENNVGLCSVDDRLLQIECTPVEMKKPDIIEKSVLSSRLAKRLKTPVKNIETKPLVYRKQVKHSVIKVHNNEKLRKLLSKSLIN